MSLSKLRLYLQRERLLQYKSFESFIHVNCLNKDNNKLGNKIWCYACFFRFDEPSNKRLYIRKNKVNYLQKNVFDYVPPGWINYDNKWICRLCKKQYNLSKCYNKYCRNGFKNDWRTCRNRLRKTRKNEIIGFNCYAKICYSCKTCVCGYKFLHIQDFL